MKPLIILMVSLVGCGDLAVYQPGDSSVRDVGAGDSAVRDSGDSAVTTELGGDVADSSVISDAAPDASVDTDRVDVVTATDTPAAPDVTDVPADVQCPFLRTSCNGGACWEIGMTRDSCGDCHVVCGFEFGCIGTYQEHRSCCRQMTSGCDPSNCPSPAFCTQAGTPYTFCCSDSGSI